jgi:uncharacterized surface anchored protein
MIGVDIVDQDFLDEPVASISGSIEEDQNGDGLPDAPIAGVVVELVDGAGVVVASVLTDINGDYVFADVAPGAYTIVESDPAGYESVSDVSGPNDNVIAVTMIGVDIVDQDFVDELVPSSVSGSVFADLDGDGLPDQPIEGVVVTLFDDLGVIVEQTTTGADGSYAFFNVPPGTYEIVETDPANYGSVSDISGPNDNTIPLTVPSGGDPITNQDFVDEPAASIAGTVWEDVGHDGTPDSPIAGVTIELLDAAGVVIASTITGADGTYLFEGLLPGNYVVQEVDPADFSSTSDVDGANDNRIAATLAGVDVVGRDFVDVAVYMISGTVLVDTDDDGVNDSQLAGVIINLADALGAIIATTTTDSAGDYSFGGLLPGQYTITQTQPADYESLSDVEGANDNGIVVNVGNASLVGQDFVERPLAILPATGQPIDIFARIGALALIIGAAILLGTRRSEETA